MLGTELFSDLPKEELSRLVAIAQRRRFARNEVVFHRGDPADTLHLVADGYFAARLQTRRGDTVTVAVHGRGDAFGELALLDSDRPRSTTVTALAAGETYAVRRNDFDRLLAERLRRTSELLAEALFVGAEVRILRRLGELVELYGDGASGTVVPLGQDELAGLAGTSRATVNRVLRAEAARGTLELRRNQVRVVDAAALAARAARPAEALV